MGGFPVCGLKTGSIVELLMLGIYTKMVHSIPAWVRKRCIHQRQSAYLSGTIEEAYLATCLKRTTAAS